MSSNFLRSAVGLALLLVPGLALSRAGEGRNGGYGVQLSGKLFSLDLAEQSLHLKPQRAQVSDEALSDDQRRSIRLAIAGAMQNDGRRQEVYQIVEARFSDLLALQRKVEIDFDFGAVIEEMENYFWIYHAVDCLDANDDKSKVFNSKTQVAYRQGLWIRFCKQSRALDAANLAALVLHEAVYASLRVKSVTKNMVAFAFNPEQLSQALSEDNSEALRTFQGLAHDLYEAQAARIRILKDPKLYPKPELGVYAGDNGDQVRIFERSVYGEVEGLVDENGMGVELDSIKAAWPYAKDRPAIFHKFDCDSDLVCRHQSDLNTRTITFIEIVSPTEIVFHESGGHRPNRLQWVAQE